MAYHAGKFLNASFDKASDENERQSFKISDAQRPRDRAGPDRRVWWRGGSSPSSRKGPSVTAGQRVGLIRFGSRCDVYLPQGVEPLVLIGQRTLAGETVLADLFGNQPKRQGRAG